AAATTVTPEHLGRFFAKIYAILNAIALVIQLFVAPWLVARFGVVAALVALPLAIAGGAVAFLGFGGLAPVLVLKLADGAFRNSLTRVGEGPLLLPRPPPKRAAAKPIIETAGTRGGQALASTLILVLLLLGGGAAALAVTAAVLAICWLAAIVGL